MNSNSRHAQAMFRLPRLMGARGLASTMALTVMASSGAQAQAQAQASKPAPAQAPLELKVINHGPASFHVNSVLVQGEKEALLLDAGFTRADGLRLAAAVLDSGKTLSTIYVSAADPDYYFGLEVLHAQFPSARIVTTAQNLKKIEASLPTKLQVWGPRLGANAPRTPVLPEALSGNTLQLEGRTLEILGLDDALAHRSHVWIPSIQAVVGGVSVFGGLHAWTADTQTAAERATWLAKLDAIAALHPKTVVPGHMQPGTALDGSALAYTRGYLQRFEAELPKAGNSAELISAMKAAYPQAALGMALDIGAKVNKGEMKW